MPRKAEIGATRDSHIYRVRVPAGLQAQWEEWCAKSDKKPSEVIRALMRYLVQDNIPNEVRNWVAAQAAGHPDDGPKERSRFDSHQPSTRASRPRPTPRAVPLIAGSSTACGPA